MKRITPYIITITALILSCCSSFAQMNVSVRAAVNRDKIMIGEPVELKLEASVPASSEAAWFPLDSMKHFEFIDKGKIDTITTAEGRTYRQTLVITSFDSGRWAVPSLPFTIGNKEYLTDSLPVSVAYSNFDPKQDYHDIKEIIEVENTSVQYINWIVLATALLALLAIVYFLRKKVVLPPAVAVKKSQLMLSPLLEAIQAIELLQKRSYNEQLHTKIFHAELNDIFRQYLYRKTTVATMEKTSGDLMLQLRQFTLPDDDFTRLAQVLRMNDAVKFAKYQPLEEENQQAINTIKKSVEQLDSIIL